MTVYLDCNATTPIDPEVAKIVRHYMEVDFGNAGSRTHEYGQRAKKAVELAREQVAAVASAKPDEVIFTSGATESNNLAILGLENEGRRSGRLHIVSTQIEHRAVLEPLAEMGRRGFEVTLVPPGSGGFVEPGQLREAIRQDTLLVSVMHVNNETGIIQDIDGIAQALVSTAAFLHVDAAQGFGKIPGLDSDRIDMISVSAHKIHSPKGVGCLIARRRRWSRPPLSPILFGGGQEHGLRPGTLPVPLIAGFGVAATRAPRRYSALDNSDNLEFREKLIGQLGQLGIKPLGDQQRCIKSTLAFALPSIDSEAAILALKGEFAISNGAACSSSGYKESHVLAAMGMVGRGMIRLSWSDCVPVAHACRIASLLRSIIPSR